MRIHSAFRADLRNVIEKASRPSPVLGEAWAKLPAADRDTLERRVHELRLDTRLATLTVTMNIYGCGSPRRGEGEQRSGAVEAVPGRRRSMEDVLLSDHQRRLRDHFLAAPVLPAPAPWHPVRDRRTPIGGLLGIGFSVHPDSGHDLVMVVSLDGHGLFDAVTGEKIAREHEPDPATSTPEDTPDLACPGLGPIAGTRVHIAGLSGGGLHRTTPDGWALDTVAPEWPNERVLLSSDGDIYRDPPGRGWWHIFHSDYSTFRAAGFSPSGLTLAIATSSDLTLWRRPTLDGRT